MAVKVVPIRTLQRVFSPNNVGTTRSMIPCSPTSSDTAAHNLDTASNPSSSPQFTEDIPSTVLQVEMSSLFEEQDAHDNDTSYIKAPFINALEGKQH